MVQDTGNFGFSSKFDKAGCETFLFLASKIKMKAKIVKSNSSENWMHREVPCPLTSKLDSRTPSIIRLCSVTLPKLNSQMHTSILMLEYM